VHKLQSGEGTEQFSKIYGMILTKHHHHAAAKAARFYPEPITNKFINMQFFQAP
jgi:hypothetical protein